MAETLGSLCDKLTIVKLKQWHSEDEQRLRSLDAQQRQLEEEIDTLMHDAASGRVPPERLTFTANKVYKAESNETPEVSGSIGQIVSRLATTNCRLWHEQEKVYDFENVPSEEKDGVVKNLAVLNLERTRCIDAIDGRFRELIERALSSE